MFESGSAWVSFSRATLKDALVIGLQDNWECFFFSQKHQGWLPDGRGGKGCVIV